jgi:hypothetical protein
MSASPASAIAVHDSITHLVPEDEGRVVVAGSHGGVYAAYCAAAGHVRAVILNDAGIGLENAGIACLAYYDAIDGAACTVAHTSCRIGDGNDMMARGVISGVNRAAAACGCAVGQSCAEAAQHLTQAAAPTKPYEAHAESRFLFEDGPIQVWGIDSVSLIRPEDTGHIVIAGSHGGALGGRPETALKYPAAAAVFNDAGVGRDEAGLSRLPALDQRNIASATVSAMSARIGDARSMWETGRISHVNEAAKRAGVSIGMSVADFVKCIRSAALQKR